VHYYTEIDKKGGTLDREAGNSPNKRPDIQIGGKAGTMRKPKSDEQQKDLVTS